MQKLLHARWIWVKLNGIRSSPGLGHFDQQGFVSLIHCLASQAKAFGRAPFMILEFGHEPSALRGNANGAALFQ
jgi:hypothetical protein